MVDRTLLAMPVVAVLPGGHRLAERRAVRLAELADESFILVPRTIGPGWHDVVTAACRGAGFSPHVIQESSRSTSAVHFVAAGLGITVVPGWLAAMAVAGVVYLPIAPASPKARIALVHRRDAVPALTHNFLRLARETVGGEGDVR
jgi:DNA-binding transcriptional LysR family regulator